MDQVHVNASYIILSFSISFGLEECLCVCVCVYIYMYNSITTTIFYQKKKKNPYNNEKCGICTLDTVGNTKRC